MKSYEELERNAYVKAEQIVAKQKRRRTMILRSCAISAGAAAVLGIGLTTYALRPPKKPAPSQSGIVAETETTSAETTAALTSPSTAAPLTTTTVRTTATAEVTTASSTQQTSTTVRSTTKASLTTTVAAQTTEATADTTAAAQTSPPSVTSLAPTTEDIEERIANIVMRMPEMITVAKTLPAVDENGNRIPTFPMLVGDDRNYMRILQYDSGQFDFTMDFNDDGKVDLYDTFEFEAYLFCQDQYNRTKRYPYNFDEMFPDMEIFDRADSFYDSHRDIYLLTYYMIYHDVDIPDAETIEEIAREYAGSRPFPDFVYTNLSKDVGGIKDKYDERYEAEYENLNRSEDEYPDFQLNAFKKIDSGELFPDADRDGSVGYMDTYVILRYYSEKSVDFAHGIYSDSDIEWIEANCDIDGDGRVNTKDSSLLMVYLFYYKNYDYVTQIEMKMEYMASQESKALLSP